MKKTSLALLSLVIAGTACAEDLLKPEEHPVSVCALSLAAPLQVPTSNVTIDGLRLNLIYGDHYGVNGLDIGFAGTSRANANGLQLDVAAGWDVFDFNGCQIAGLGNAVLGNARGFQLAGAINFVRGGFTGFQLAPFNFDGASTGMQVGAININKGLSYGLQVGAYNGNPNEYHGWSVGAVNCTDRMDGLQLGVINIAVQTGNGIQIGVINSAAVYSGVQIGVLNLIGNGDLPIMPILNANF